MTLPILQVITPESTTDYFSVWVNAGAVFSGVVVSFALNLLDRKRCKEVERRNSLIADYNYLRSYLSANMEVLINTLVSITQATDFFIQYKYPQQVGKPTLLKIDYSKINHLNKYELDLFSRLVVQNNLMESLVFIHDNYLEDIKLKLDAPVNIAQVLYVYLEELILNFRALQDIEEEYLRVDRFSPNIFGKKSFLYYKLPDCNMVASNYIFPEAINDLFSKVEVLQAQLKQEYCDDTFPEFFSQRTSALDSFLASF
ncbi:MAG: hypothetical protein ACERJ1_05365 [Halodesulfovibrio sp.]|uniref:hypothetical protein n=1 Tax=Halodesulfovibrio sp. TaxID=1912772 RepID=UPI00359D7B7D